MTIAMKRMPEYIPTPGPAPNGMQQRLPHYEVYRYDSALTAMHYCTGGIINISSIVEGHRYLLKLGLVTDYGPDDAMTTKIRAISVLVNRPDYPREDGFLWDSSQDDGTWGLTTGVYKLLYVLSHHGDGGMPEHLDNCVRIASGVYNTLARKGIDPSRYMDHHTVARALCSVNWAEMIGEWIVSPLAHHSMVAFPLPHKPREEYPKHYRARVDCYRLAVREAQTGLPPPSYFQSLASSECNGSEFIRVIGHIIARRPGANLALAQSLIDYEIDSIDPDVVLEELTNHPEYHSTLDHLTRFRNTIPVDPAGLCARVFLLAFEKEDDHVYRNRKLVHTDKGVVPYTWPHELFGSKPYQPYCTEQSSGAMIRNKYVPKTVHPNWERRSAANRRELVWASYTPQIQSLPDYRETDSFVAFLKVDSPDRTFGAFVDYDVSRDPGPLVLTNGKGGPVFRLSPWRWTRILRTLGGMSAVGALPPTVFPDYSVGNKGAQVVLPMCNGTVHYVSPPLKEDYICSTLDQRTNYMLEKGFTPF